MSPSRQHVRSRSTAMRPIGGVSGAGSAALLIALGAIAFTQRFQHLQTHQYLLYGVAATTASACLILRLRNSAASASLTPLVLTGVSILACLALVLER